MLYTKKIPIPTDNNEKISLRMVDCVFFSMIECMISTIISRDMDKTSLLNQLDLTLLKVNIAFDGFPR
jgi:hypothetical protein